MILKNDSSYPTAELEQLIKFAASVNTTQPIELDRIFVHVKHTRGKFSGEAFDAQPPEEWTGVDLWSNYGYDFADYYVFLCIPHAHKFPQSSLIRGKPYGGELSSVYVCQDWKECVAAVAAHELHHVALWQRQLRHVTLQSDEARCERQAAYALHRFRQANLEMAQSPKVETVAA
jgi:hypothetical protein